MLQLMKADGICVFNEEGLCSIHEFKPEVCRKFPFFNYLNIPYVRGVWTCPELKKLKKDLNKK